MVREVVAEVWQLFVRRFWRTLVIVALMLAPLELAVQILDPDLASNEWWLWVATSATLVVVAFPWVIGAVVHDVAAGAGTPAHAYRTTATRLPDLGLTALITTVGIALGTLALAVPGLLLMARWGLVVPLIVVEHAPWRVALRRSNELVRGRTWTVVAVFIVLTLVGAALVALPVLVGYLVLGGVLGAWVATLAVDTVAVAFYSFAPFVLYRRFAG